MTEIDICSLQNKICMEVIQQKKYRIQKTIIALTTGTEIGIGLNANDGAAKTLIFLGAVLTAAVGTKVINNEYSKEYKNKIHDKLIQTKEYKKCMKEYKQFVSNLANLIKKLNIKNSKEIICFYEYMLNSGLLSKRSTESGELFHEYYLYKNEKNIIEELSGARIASGRTVCRHQSAMLIDLLNKLGIKACNISCKHTDLKKCKKLIKRKSKDYNHSIVGIIENDNKYIFDCTMDSFVIVSTEKEYKNSLAKNIEIEDDYYYLSKECININEKLRRIRNQFDEIKNSQINKDELIEIRKKIKKLVEEKKEIILAFNSKEQRRINTINQLESILCPADDTPQQLNFEI